MIDDYLKLTNQVDLPRDDRVHQFMMIQYPFAKVVVQVSCVCIIIGFFNDQFFFLTKVMTFWAWSHSERFNGNIMR